MTAPVIAVVGGGQLARMMTPPAAELGVHLRVLVEADDGPVAQVLPDSPVGVAADEAAIRALIAGTSSPHRQAAAVGACCQPGCPAHQGAPPHEPLAPVPASVLTFEHEHVPNQLLQDLLDHGTPVHPGPHALIFAQDKIAMRTKMDELGLPNPRWAPIPSEPAAAGLVITDFLAQAPTGEAVLKTSRGGYDGKGVRVIADAAAAADWIAAAAAGGPQLLIEEKVPFTRELAALVARRPSGEVRTWSVVESIQRGGVCSEVIAPAPGLPAGREAEVRHLAETIATRLDVTGVLAVELFEAPDAAGTPQVYINELAMRPHNSGHWTIDGAVTSQFEQHLRAVLDWPLGSTEPVARWTVMANVLGSTLPSLTDALPELLARFPEAKVNLYGKEIRAGRKLAHVNVSGTDLETVRERARAAAALLRGEAG